MFSRLPVRKLAAWCLIDLEASVTAILTSRQDWLQSRKQAIGASDLAAVLGVSRWSTPWEIWAEKRGMLESDSGSKSASAGIALESAVLDVAESELGALDRNVRVVHASLPLAATCDAIVKQTGSPVEAKTTGIAGPIYGNWGDSHTDQVPDDYLLQVHAQLMCTGMDVGYLFALIPGRGFVQFDIESNECLHNYIGDYVSAWWSRHIIQGIEPSFDQSINIDVVKRLKRESGKIIESTEGIEILVSRREKIKSEITVLNKEVEEIEKLVLKSLGDAEGAALNDGRILSYEKIFRKGYVVEPGEYRRLAIKRGKNEQGSN